jgi:hypothetical protein
MWFLSPCYSLRPVLRIVFVQLVLSDDVERLAPPMKDVSVEWSVSYESRASALHRESASSDDSSDEDEGWISFM